MEVLASARDLHFKFGQKPAPMRVAAKEAEELKGEFMKSAPWQDTLRKFVGL